MKKAEKQRTEEIEEYKEYVGTDEYCRRYGQRQARHGKGE